MSLIRDTDTLEKARDCAARVKRDSHAGSDPWIVASYLNDLLSGSVCINHCAITVMWENKNPQCPLCSSYETENL